MQTVYPPDRVFVSDLVPDKYVLSNGTPFQSMFTESEKYSLVNKYAKPNLFDGTCIRLDGVSEDAGRLSITSFYEFMCAHIIAIYNKEPEVLDKLKMVVSKYGKLRTFDDCLRISEFPNPIATSVLVKDITNRYILIERNTYVSIGTGSFAATSSGAVSHEDLYSSNPIKSCAMRELREELGLNVELFQTGLIVAKQKLQPIALLSGTLQCKWEDVLPTMSKARDFKLENSRLLLVPKEDLLKLISVFAFTDATAYQIFAECNATMKDWKALKNFNFTNLEQYYVDIV